MDRSVFSKVCWTPVSLKVDYRIDIPIHNGQTLMIKKEFASKTNQNVSQEVSQTVRSITHRLECKRILIT